MTPVEQIKSRLSIADVVSTYLKLTRAGSNFKAVCPFHSEKSASFFVSPARDAWHCFGCQKGGDVFSFVMEIEGIDFREALKLLAERAGVELRNENPEDRSERSRLFSLLEEAARFYQECLSHTPAVQGYLLRRGVHPDTIAKFHIGYAPPETSSWRVITEHALKKGYTFQELEKSGLAIKKQSPSPNSYNLMPSAYYDRFRNRITFPIADTNGRTIGFGGRIFDEFQMEGKEMPAKYINTPQTMLYDKSRVLYAFDKAKATIRKENKCILVEGYMDVVMAHQAGTEHTVAVSGTALTRDQLTLLRRLCDQIILSFDMDDAGESATRRSIDLALVMGFDVKAIAMPSGKDPADLVQSDVASWQRVAGEATDIISYFLEKALRRYDTRTLDGKRGVAKSVLPLVSHLMREVDKAHWVSVIASRFGAREESVWEDVRKYTTAETKRFVPSSAAGTAQKNGNGLLSDGREQSRTRVLEERILGILYAYGIPAPIGVSDNLFSSGNPRTLFMALPARMNLTALANEDLRSFANRLIFEAEMLVPAETASTECVACVAELQRERVKEKLTRLTLDIRKAEEAGNAQQISPLIEEFRELSKQLV